MSRIRSVATKPELKIREILRVAGVRGARYNPKGIAGRPDITLPNEKKAIFVHGCFWHRHVGCKFAYQPKSNQLFWDGKFQANVNRDLEVRGLLKKAGWKVRVIWECEIKKRAPERNILRKIKPIIIRKKPVSREN